MTYSPFFAGAAGSGHIWHWDSYVDQKNLWHGFRALADAVHGIAVDREKFIPVDQSTDDYWCLLLRGRSVSLAWLRNRADRWDFVLRDGNVPPRIESARIDLTVLDAAITNVEVLQPWDDDGIGDAIVDGSSVVLPAFRHGLICRLQH